MSSGAVWAASSTAIRIPGKSPLFVDPKTLQPRAGTGQPRGIGPRGKPCFKEIVDFGSPIGLSMAFQQVRE